MDFNNHNDDDLIENEDEGGDENFWEYFGEFFAEIFGDSWKNNWKGFLGKRGWDTCNINFHLKCLTPCGYKFDLK